MGDKTRGKNNMKKYNNRTKEYLQQKLKKRKEEERKEKVKEFLEKHIDFNFILAELYKKFANTSN